MLHSTQEVSSKYMIETVDNWKVTVTTVAQRLSATSSSKKMLIIRADKNNSGDVWYGGSTIDGTNSDYLSPGEVRTFHFIDPYILYVLGTLNDKIYCETLE